MSKNVSRRHLFWILPTAIVAIGSIALGARMMAPPPLRPRPGAQQVD